MSLLGDYRLPRHFGPSLAGHRSFGKCLGSSRLYPSRQGKGDSAVAEICGASVSENSVSRITDRVSRTCQRGPRPCTGSTRRASSTRSTSRSATARSATSRPMQRSGGPTRPSRRAGPVGWAAAVPLRLVDEVLVGPFQVTGEKEQRSCSAQPIPVGEGGARDRLTVVPAGERPQEVSFRVVDVGPGMQSVDIAHDDRERQRIQGVRRGTRSSTWTGTTLRRPHD